MFHFLWNLHQSQRIDSLSRQVETGAVGSSHQSARAEREVRRLEERLETMHLVMMSMWAVMQKKLGVTDEELAEMVRELDLRDGKLDGRMTPRVSTCAGCGRTMSERHTRCMYCGGDRLSRSH